MRRECLIESQSRSLQRSEDTLQNHRGGTESARNEGKSEKRIFGEESFILPLCKRNEKRVIRMFEKVLREFKCFFFFTKDFENLENYKERGEEISSVFVNCEFLKKRIFFFIKS